MQGFLATIITAFTPQVLFAMLGGFIGALISSDRKRYGWQLSLLFMVVAIFASAGMADYLYTNKKIVSIWWMFSLNVPLGMVIGATLDAIRITSPRLIEQLVNKLGNGAVSIIGDAIIDKLNAILGKSVVLKDDDGITDSSSSIDKN